MEKIKSGWIWDPFWFQAHLKSVPNYIVPQTLRKLNHGGSGRGGGDGKAGGTVKKGFKKGQQTSAAKRKFQKQQGDALRGIAKR